MAADRSAAELERFLGERADHLLRTAMLLTGSRDAGEDLLQTAVERLLRRWRRFDGDPEGYLRRTLCNLATDEHRRAGRLRQKERLLRTGAARQMHDATGEVDLRDALVRLQAPAGLTQQVVRRRRRRLRSPLPTSVGCGPLLAAGAMLFQPGLPGVDFSVGSPPATMAESLRAAVSCGSLAEAGRQRVDGVDAIKLVSGPGDPISETIWVSPGTYLPVRVAVTAGFRSLTADITWLQPTSQNLAKLTVPIPAGYRQVSLPETLGEIMLRTPGGLRPGFCLLSLPGQQCAVVPSLAYLQQGGSG